MRLKKESRQRQQRLLGSGVDNRRLIKNKEPSGPPEGSKRTKRKALLETIRLPPKAGELRAAAGGLGHISQISLIGWAHPLPAVFLYEKSSLAVALEND